MKMWKAIAIGAVLGVIGALGYAPRGSAQEGKNIEQLITEAKTPADHAAAAAFYRKESSELQKEADQHSTLAKKLVSEAGGQNPSASHHYEQAEHCRKFADSLSTAAQEAQALAKIHERLEQSPVEKKK